MRPVRSAVLAVVLAVPLTGCAGTTSASMPSCTAVSRLALIAQSVPGAAYVPCLAPLPRGWTAGAASVASGRTHFSLSTDQAPGHPVLIEFRARCHFAGGTDGPPRAPGVRTAIALHSISPRYEGTLYDQFTGGCISYRFDFERGPHIPLMEDLERAVQLRSRQTLAAAVRRQLGVDLDPPQ